MNTAKDLLKSKSEILDLTERLVKMKDIKIFTEKEFTEKEKNY